MKIIESGNKEMKAKMAVMKSGEMRKYRKSVS